jgi:hypothetical protein
MLVDTLSSAPHYRSHSIPLWDALQVDMRGDRFDLDTSGRSKRTDGSRAVLVASARDMGHAWMRGYRRIALMEHGAGQSYTGFDNSGYPGSPGRDFIGLFLSPNEGAAAKDRAAYPRARVEVIGDPVLDTLPRGLVDLWTGSAADVSDALERDLYGTDDDPVVAISFHWNWTRLPELTSAAPHFLSALPELARRWKVIGHAHPRMIDQLEPIYERCGIEVVRSFEEVCRRASVYACDNSSSIFEFASTGRPVVLLNAPWFRRDVEHGLRFWAAAGVGRQVDRPEELAEVIECSLSEPPLSTVGPALRLAYSFSTGAAQRGATILADWAA